MGSESDARIRKAVEQIIGQPLAQRWPEDVLPPGARVRVIQDRGWRGPWQREFLGTISGMAAPEPVNNPRAFVGELKYWVDFDEPQYDADAADKRRPHSSSVSLTSSVKVAVPLHLIP